MNDISLLPAELDTGIPLMQALSLRKSTKEYREADLSLQELSNLLWTAGGINRRNTQNLVNPTARNVQFLDIYVILKNAAYLYDKNRHILKFLKKGDFRKVSGRNEYVWTAPVNLAFVADHSRVGDAMNKEIALKYAKVNSGYISQSVYLFAASFSLGSVARGNFDEPALKSAIGLGPDQEIVLTQTVGYPK